MQMLKLNCYYLENKRKNPRNVMLTLQLGGKLMHDAHGNRMEPSDGDISRKARASRPFARSPQLEEGLWKEKSIIMSHSVRESV